MIRWVQALVVLAGVLAVAQAAILALSEPGARRRLAAQLGDVPRGVFEERLAAWRRRRRRQLWINVVAVPCLVLLVLIVVGEFG